ncbi:MAG: transglycosylase domain-containing protein [Actinomycetota bacterium]|nr:transglycosylase domain-containing protein [Actinomycetota bacterium]
MLREYVNANSSDRHHADPPRWRRLPWARIGLATLALLVVVAAVPPLRRVTALGVSKVILFVASPLAPGVGELEKLPEATKVVALDGSVLADLGEERRSLIALDSLPEHVPKAVLAAEDAQFYSHSGVDPTAVFRALLRNTTGSRTQGGSTITQQLAKINNTGSARSFLRKFKEVLYASKLERRYSKDELLERYLNQVYFGEGAYGIAVASRTFFGVAPEQLSVPQAATLAGKIRSPEGLDPRTAPGEVQARRDQVLRNMAKHGWLDEAGLAQARSAPLGVVAPPPAVTPMRAPHFVEYVKREARGIDQLGASPESRGRQLFTGGFTVETTLDPKVFDAATQAVAKTLGLPTDPTAAVASVQPGDGAIRNLFGGLDFATQKFDTASQARRQPGSAYKPFVYLAGLREGVDPRTRFDASSPKQFEYRGQRFPVENYEGEGRGPTTVDDGLVHSINVVYMALGLEAGPANVARVAQDLGAPDEEVEVPEVPAIALGGLKDGVTPLEMAAAFATFAAKGVYAEPYAIARIKDRSGNVVYSRRPSTRNVLLPDEVGVLNNPMQRVVREGTGRGAALDRPMAGKTGTTQENKDAWFVGYVPQMATAVWNGYLEPKPMRNVHGRSVTGGSFPATIWRDTMRVALQGVRPEPLYTASPESLGLRVASPPPPPPPPPTVATIPTTTTLPYSDLPPLPPLPDYYPPTTQYRPRRPPAPVTTRPGSTSTTSSTTTTTTVGSSRN